MFCNLKKKQLKEDNYEIPTLTDLNGKAQKHRNLLPVSIDNKNLFFIVDRQSESQHIC